MSDQELKNLCIYAKAIRNSYAMADWELAEYKKMLEHMLDQANNHNNIIKETE